MDKIFKICFIFCATFSIAGAEDKPGKPGKPCIYYPLCDECPLNDQGVAVCIRCRNMYGLDLTAIPELSCVDCRNFTGSSTGCQLCSHITRCDNCTSCKDGPDDDGKATCSPCPDNCYSCKSSSKICDQCDEGFFLRNGQCLSCPSSCRQCIDESTCSYCSNGFYEDKKQQACIKCAIENCFICQDGSTCNVCNDGYYLQNAKKCTSCPQNCQKCDDNGKCSKCKAGRISADGSCACDPNCNSCQNNGWGKCDPGNCRNGYKLNANKICEPIHD